MSTLLEQASLVMIPSGYKENVVYSQIPTSGAGDLSFTRASNGTRINSAGLVEVCPWNFCNFSEDFTQWASSNATTVTANSTTAPNGTTTADTITPTAVNDDHYRGIVLSPQVGALTSFIYVKPNGNNFFDWGIWNGSQYIVRATFDLVNLTYTFTNAGTATIESVGNGWLKCGISGTNASLSNIDLYFRTRPTGGTGAFTGNGTSGAFVWGAQLNIGSTAKPYFPTTDRLNVPRLTYQNGGGGCPSLLLEKQSTNLTLYSEQLGNAAWNKINVSVSANQAAAPDGTTSADLIYPTTTGDNRLIEQFFAAGAGQTWTTSFFVKASGFSWVIIYAPTGGGASWFNASTGVFGTIAAGSTAAVLGQVNGFWRISITATLAGTNTYFYAGPADANGSITATANGTNGLLIWGCQLELSSYATSYIPTTTSSATRVADACYKTGISSLIGGTSGTVFFDIKTNPVLSLSNYKQFCYYFTSGGAQSYMYLNSSNQISTNSNWASLFYNTALQPNTRYKVALVYAPNDFALYVNGVSVATASSGTPLNNADISIGQLNGTENCEFVFNQYTHFPSRLTNAELASLTTL